MTDSYKTTSGRRRRHGRCRRDRRHNHRRATATVSTAAVTAAAAVAAAITAAAVTTAATATVAATAEAAASTAAAPWAAAAAAAEATGFVGFTHVQGAAIDLFAVHFTNRCLRRCLFSIFDEAETAILARNVTVRNGGCRGDRAERREHLVDFF